MKSNTLQHTATHCNALQHTATLQRWAQILKSQLITSDVHIYICPKTHRKQHTATHCNTLQRTATDCNTTAMGTHSQKVSSILVIFTYIYIPRPMKSNTLQHTATHCNTLQHTAAPCSTLQHTATPCNTRIYSIYISQDQKLALIAMGTHSQKSAHLQRCTHIYMSQDP